MANLPPLLHHQNEAAARARLSPAGARVLARMLLGEHFQITTSYAGEYHQEPSFSANWGLHVACPNCGHRTGGEPADLRSIWKLFERGFLNDRGPNGHIGHAYGRAHVSAKGRDALAEYAATPRGRDELGDLIRALDAPEQVQVPRA